MVKVLTLPVIQPSDKNFIATQLAEENWRAEEISGDILGTPRPMIIYRASRRSDPVKHTWHGSILTFCPPKWYDLGIGSGACGYRCRYCFLMLTFRAMRDPSSPVLYDNVDYFWTQVSKWLVADRWKTKQVTPNGKKVRHNPRSSHDTLGLGIDCSDSLLFEGVTGHARQLIPMFADPQKNPRRNKLILLTKSANDHFLHGLQPTNTVAVTFSLNPEREADLWEGKYSDGVRITPPIIERLKASKRLQDLGFETRWRIDPILTLGGWERDYRDFFAEAAALGLTPRYITLGTYRRKNPMLDFWRSAWNLPAPEWEPDHLILDGSHEHIEAETRLRIYSTIISQVNNAAWKGHAPAVELCKEPHALRTKLALEGVHCNCLQ